VHELAEVAEADIAVAQFGPGQHASAALARGVVSLKGEIHFVDAVAFRRGPERRLGASCGAAKTDAVLALHFR
jgi:hypothetical protein